ncbi:MAG: hypothetical protein LIP09_07350 [Bacteroidales bacterium]|nr:hypothetical protein [Bacteroidales bacterium]
MKTEQSKLILQWLKQGWIESRELSQLEKPKTDNRPREEKIGNIRRLAHSHIDGYCYRIKATGRCRYYTPDGD